MLRKARPSSLRKQRIALISARQFAAVVLYPIVVVEDSSLVSLISVLVKSLAVMRLISRNALAKA